MNLSEYAVIDIETTGLDRSTDRVIEIAVIRLDFELRELARWHTLVDPGRPSGAVEIHGITDDLLRSAPRFSEIAAELTEQLRGRRIVAHNAKFDREFLNGELARAGFLERIDKESCVCTMDQSRIYLEPGSHSLRGLASRLGIKTERAHRSISDAETCVRLLRIFAEQEARGERYVDRAVNRDDAVVLPAQWKRALSRGTIAKKAADGSVYSR
ncbi:DNA polymerase-3 subunit epsilon [Trueperella bonasi]|uniref:DNA polymerase-3 subunit epsilon n=1 Tax=Trueperella bonasi TaxID=312286 RepID=A0ABT9NJB2_9ACTO|nr:3'-5' exonuclease [Trueperella bonasi]MDP9807118.1 DNA polymerase-3 subunit epsilon [Trueperella bonasi]